ncbi:MAG: hypothetical protein IJZ94_04140 [Clostridia bacterium]|nr:hypothetical protein [Clostridia bacterium]
MLKFSFNFKKVFLIVLIVFIALYTIMVLNTNSVIRYAKSVFLGEISLEEVVDTPLYRYYPKDLEIATTDLSINRIFVAHNFKEGYIWVKYDEERMDSSGNILSGSWDAVSRWKIHKENGEWKVIEIKEAP